MELAHVTYAGPPVDDEESLAALPPALRSLLSQINGFIQYDGGLHVRGACLAPEWHSLRDAWRGDDAFHRLYPDVHPTDIPIAEDCVGDQLLIRDGLVWRLWCETGELECLDASFFELLERAEQDPVEVLSMQPLLLHLEEAEPLLPGQLLSVYPPFCTRESRRGVSTRALSALERRRWLADFAAQLRGVP